MRSLRAQSRTRGQATVEFAFVIVFLMALALSLIELVMMMHTYNVLADAAKEGVRYAIVHGTGNSQHTGPTTGPSCTTACTDIIGPAAPPGTVPGYGSGYGVVKTYAQYSLHDISNLTVTATYPDATPSNQAPNRVQVQVSYPYGAFFGLGWPTITVNANAEGRIAN